MKITTEKDLFLETLITGKVVQEIENKIRIS